MAELYNLPVFEDRIVFIKKVVVKSAQGRHRHEKDGKKIHKTQAGKASTTWKISALEKTDNLNTGLDKLTLNPYYKEGDKEPTEDLPAAYAGQGIQNSKTITWQLLFEIKHNKPVGYYSSRRAIISEITPKTQRTALQAFSYVLNDGTTALDLKNPKDQLMYFFANQSQKFAKNEAAVKKNAYAVFYLAETNEPEDFKRSKLRLLEDAMYNLTTLRKGYNESAMMQFATILKTVRGKVSFNAAANSLHEYISDTEIKPEVMRERLVKFNELFEILRKEGGRFEFETRYLLQALLNLSIIMNSSETYIWLSKKGTDLEIIGKTYARAINFLKDPDKHEYRQLLEEELEFKKSFQ